MKTQCIENFQKTLITGEKIRLRLVRQDDIPRMQALFQTFSPETVFHRFQEPIAEMTPERARRFVENDPDEVVAVVAYFDNGSGEEVFTGVARFGLSEDNSAEYAIVVGDPWQRQGIGRMLMAALALAAVDNGVEWFECTFDMCNNGFLDFAEASGVKGAISYEYGQLRMRTAVADIIAASPEAAACPL